MNGYGADDGGEGKDGVVGNVTDLLVELREYCGTGVPGEENAALQACRSGMSWKVWTGGQVMPIEGAGQGARQKKITIKLRCEVADTGGIRAILGGNRWSNETCWDGSLTVVPERGEMGVAGFYEISEVEKGRTTFTFPRKWWAGQVSRAGSRGRARSGAYRGEGRGARSRQRGF